ncbi:MAG: hypothetical protein KDA75_16980, partial [Planctomycetaceae bacterium]|nr:hypothetical protein [Planctomycetaceae bacterium]
VVAVVAGTLLGCLPLFAAIEWFANDVLDIRNGYVSPIAFCGLGLLDVWLVLRWCGGESVALPRPTRWIELLTDRWCRTREVSLPCLQRVATQGSPTLRLLGVQVWREVRSALPFVVLWSVLGLAFLAPAVWANSRSFPVEALGVFAMVYWQITPGLCGLMAAAGDQRSGQHRFLGQHGVSGTSTWLAKQLVWLTVACLLVVGWTWMQHSLATSGDAERFTSGRSQFTRSYIGEMTRSVHIPRLNNLGLDTPEDWALRREFVVWMGLGFYSVGQLCGFWFRNAVVAGGMMLFLSAPVLLWQFVQVTFDIPLWMGTGPLVLLWLVATWRLMDDWLCGRSSRRLHWRQAAWLLLPMLAAGAMASVARRTQIPEIPLPSDWASRFEEKAVALREITPEFRQEWDAWCDRLDTYHLDLAVVQAAQIPVASESSNPRVESERQMIDEFLARVAAAIYTDKFALPVGAFSSDHLVPFNLAAYVEVRGPELRSRGAAERERQLYLDALRLLGRLSGQEVSLTWGALTARQRVFSLLADWTQQETRTADELRALLDDLQFQGQTRFDQWMSPSQVAAADASVTRQLIANRGPDYDALRALADDAGSDELWHWRWLQAWSRLNGDYTRTERLLRILEVEADVIAHWDRTPDAEADHSVATRVEIERWVATTAPYELAMPGTLVSDLDYLQRIDIRMTAEIACERGLKLLIALEIFRREQGNYPRSLSELVPGMLPQLPKDPFAGADFAYLPDGLPAPWVLDASRLRLDTAGAQVVDEATRGEWASSLLSQLGLIPAGQPILWSPGPRQSGFVYRSHSGEGLYRETVSGLVDGDFPARDLLPSLVQLRVLRAPADAPPAFVVLGADFQPWSTATAAGDAKSDSD